MPASLTGVLAVALFAVHLGWLPAGGYTPPAQDPVMFLRQLVLPAGALGLAQAAILARYVRTAVLDVLGEDYLRTARAKGLTLTRALVRHGLRNAAIPISTVLGLQLATLLVGAIVVDYRAMRPGFRENECVALVNKVLYDMGSEFVEGVNAISGERCSPHPHVFTDRALRPGDPAYFDILHSFNGYRTCYYRTFAVGSGSPSLVDAYKRCRYYLDIAIDKIRPGVTTGEVVELWPEAQEFGFPDEEAAFALQFGHGVGLYLGEADLQPPGLARPSRGDRGGHGVRARDLLARLRRLVGGSDRGAARGHRGRVRGDHPVPGRGSADRRQAVLYGRRDPAAGARDAIEPQHRARSGDPGGGPEDAGRRCRRGGRPMSSVEAMLATGGAFVDGAWADGERETFAVIEPSTGQPFAEVAVATAVDVDAAVGNSRHAFVEWRALSPRERGALMRQVAARIREHVDELAELEAREVGKPRRDALRFDVSYSSPAFDYFGGLAETLHGEVIDSGPIEARIKYEPYGVVAAILPFNWPPLHFAKKSAPALAAGNTVVIKPGEQAPLAVLRMVETRQPGPSAGGVQRRHRDRPRARR